MQTEEETAAAQEPILEEGSGREQVKKDICFKNPRHECLFSFDRARPNGVKLLIFVHSRRSFYFDVTVM